MDIKQKAWWWSLVPFAGRQRFATTIGDAIYLTPRQYENQDTTQIQALLKHEAVHVRQYQKEGRWFQVKYLLSRKSRANYEIEAYRAQAKYLSEQGLTPNIQQYAKNLSSLQYGFAIGYDEAYQRISEGLA